MLLNLNGNKIELNNLYRFLYPKVKSFINQNSRTEEEAKDLFQEAILVAWLNYRNGNFSGNTKNFESYIFTIVKYKWLDRLKSTERKDTERLEFADSIAIDGYYYEEVDTQKLILSLKSLGDDCQLILRLYYYEDLSFAEIGRRMGHNAGVIKTKKYRSMCKLREIYLKNE